MGANSTSTQEKWHEDLSASSPNQNTLLVLRNSSLLLLNFTSVKSETYTIKKEQLFTQGLSNSDKNKATQEPNAFFAFNKQIYPFSSSF